MKKILILSLLSLSVSAFAANSINAGATYDVGFSPDGTSLPLVLKSINSAQKSIHVAAYSFTSKPISQALLAASKRGVDVKIVADEKSNAGKYSATTFLANNGVAVKLDNHYAIMHNKFIIIDGINIETGSFNYSSAAVDKNAENVLVLWNVPKLAQSYETQWSKLWNESYLLKNNY